MGLHVHLGAIAYKYKTVIQRVLRPPFWLVLPSYVAVYYLTRGLGEHNAINIISFSFLTVLILQAAYKSPMLAEKVLGKNDISYGVYIYHIPVINIFLLYGLKGVPELFIALIIAVVLALISWFEIERPCLKLKRVSLRQV